MTTQSAPAASAATPTTTAAFNPKASRKGLGFKGFLVTLAAGAGLGVSVPQLKDRHDAALASNTRLETIFAGSNDHQIALNGQYAAKGTLTQGFYIDTASLPPKFCAVSTRKPADYQGGFVSVLPAEVRDAFYGKYAENCNLPTSNSVGGITPSVADASITARQNLIRDLMCEAAGTTGSDCAIVGSAMENANRLNEQLKLNRALRAQAGLRR